MIEAAGIGDVTVRVAVRADLPQLLALLADDVLGRGRERLEQPLPNAYVAAFDAIAGDPNNELLVAEIGGEIAGMLQLTYIPGLSRQGSWRALVESVRTKAGLRNRGIGTRLMTDALARARARGCRLVQLTTDKRRVDAKRFYERLGFTATHEGMKLPITG